MPWVNCNVTQAGPAENDNIYIALRATDGSFHNWYIAAHNMKREMLATALAAISGEKVVNVYLPDTAAYSTVNRLYVKA